MTAVRPAATVMLLRPIEGGFEVFMVRRSAASPFVPDAYVFPGGAKDEEDTSLEATALRELQEEAGIILRDGNALTMFSHWITPPSEPRRYDTRFFIAELPAGQTAIADAHETHDGIWITPREALARNTNGTMHLVYPTIKHLERLATFSSVTELLAFAQAKPIVTISPDFSAADGFSIPTELEHRW